jgi:hypothetical protein
MGKQIQVALTNEDKQLFLSFLKETADIVLLESFAKTKEGLWKDTFEKAIAGHGSYHIWNKEFPWIPEYDQVGEKAYDPNMIGWYYVPNKGDAPLIQFSRSFDIANGKHGRIYWAKDFAAPNGLNYDIEKFSKWYDSVVKWIRKNAIGKVKDGSINIYYLSSAWHLYNK